VPGCTLQFDHIGVVVASLEKGRDHFSQAFDISEWTVEFADAVNGVYVQFGRDQSGICYELVAPFGDSSPIASTLRKGDRILNHVAYLVENLKVESERLRSLGFIPTAEPKPAIAYDGRVIQFFVSRLRFIVELIECIPHAHQYLPPKPR
jgi:methylmalonyl-CoA/ethylmalonyl-CoA epimerase